MPPGGAGVGATGIGSHMDADHLASHNAATSQVRRVIERLLRDGTVVASSDGSTHDVRTVAVSAREGEALGRWIARENATRTIEIGLAYAVSALHICEGLLASGSEVARHVVLDPAQHTRFANCGLQVLEEAGVSALVEHHSEVSEIALPQFLAEGREFDLGFIDGNHRFDGVFIDLFYLRRLVCCQTWRLAKQQLTVQVCQFVTQNILSYD